MERYWERDAQRDEKTIESLHQYALSRSGSVVQSVQRKHTLQHCVTQKETTSTWILDNIINVKHQVGKRYYFGYWVMFLSDQTSHKLESLLSVRFLCTYLIKNIVKTVIL